MTCSKFVRKRDQLPAFFEAPSAKVRPDRELFRHADILPRQCLRDIKGNPTKRLDRNVGINDNDGMLKTYLSQRGNVSRLAKALAVSHSTVLGWIESRVPAERVRAVAAHTGIPPHELRPDLFEAPASDAAA